MGWQFTSSEAVAERLVWDTWHETDEGRSIVTHEQATCVAAIYLTLKHLENDNKLRSIMVKECFLRAYCCMSKAKAMKYHSKDLLRDSGIEIYERFDGITVKLRKTCEKVAGVKKRKFMDKFYKYSIAGKLEISINTVTAYISIFTN